MCKRFDDWSDDIKKYCLNNGLSFEKAQTLSKCWGKNDLILQYYDRDSEGVVKGLGLKDETPMPVVLIVTKTDNGLHFEQTEHTKKYLV